MTDESATAEPSTSGSAAGAAGAAGDNGWLYSRPDWTDKNDRPVDIPEPYWDAERKAVRVDSLIKSAKDTRNKLAEVGRENKLLAAKQMTAPESYALNVGEDTVLSRLDDPSKHPLVAAVTKHFKGVGAPQNVFDAAVSAYNEHFEAAAAAEFQEMVKRTGEPDPARAAERVRGRLDQLHTRLDGLAAKLSPSDAGRAKQLSETLKAWTFTADGADLVEKALKGELTRLVGPYAAGPAGPVDKQAATVAELDKIIGSEAYRRGDPHARQQAREVADRLAELRRAERG